LKLSICAEEGSLELRFSKLWVLVLLQVLMLLAMAVAAQSQTLRVNFSGFHPQGDGLPEGWTTWAPRSEIAPRTFVDSLHYRSRPGSLAISGDGNVAVFGGWRHSVTGVTAGRWYRFTAHYRTEGIRYEPWQVLSRLDWIDAAGKRVFHPDFPYEVRPAGQWMRVALDAPAPAGATAVWLDLFLANAPYGTVWWDDVSLEEIPDPGPRRVTIATIKYMPKGTKSAAESVRQFIEIADRAVTGPIDVILLPEGITVAGTEKSMVEVAEPLPGPTTARLAELARRKKSYVAAGVYEREGAVVYNTAVLIDRSGNLVGKYRKVYLPYNEVEDGLTQGDYYPVFQTDFGKIGMMVCYDSEFPDPARALALQGAEIILLPIWGADELLVRARAYENAVFLAQSCYSNPSFIVDPLGQVLAMATEAGTAAVATIDLNRRYKEEGIGVLRERFRKDLRLDVPMPRPGYIP